MPFLEIRNLGEDQISVCVGRWSRVFFKDFRFWMSLTSLGGDIKYRYVYVSLELTRVVRSKFKK